MKGITSVGDLSLGTVMEEGCRIVGITYFPEGGRSYLIEIERGGKSVRKWFDIRKGEERAAS